MLYAADILNKYFFLLLYTKPHIALDGGKRKMSMKN
jgi:hypothetical protein